MNMRSENQSSVSEFPGFPNCFVCGRDNPRGLRTQFSPEGEGVKALFTPDETMVGYENIIHGGIISALLDEAIIWAAYSATKRLGVTAELNIRFHRPLVVHEEYIVRGQLVENRGKLLLVESAVSDKDGIPYARAMGKIFQKS